MVSPFTRDVARVQTAKTETTNTISRVKNEIKPGKKEQEKTIDSLEQKILNTKQEVKGNLTSLSPSQKAILKRSEEAAKQLKTKALRSDIKVFGTAIEHTAKEMKIEKDAIKASAKKIEKLSRKKTSEYERKQQTFQTSIGANGRAESVKRKFNDLSNSKKAVDKKIDSVMKELEHIHAAGEKRLEKAVNIHTQYRETKDASKDFSARGSKLKDSSTFDEKLSILNTKMRDLKKLEEGLGSKAIGPPNTEQAFLSSTDKKLATLTENIKALKKEIEKTLEGEKKTTPGRRISNAIRNLFG